MFNRREFLGRQAAGLAALGLSGLAARSQAGSLQATALPPETLCLFASALPAQEAGERGGAGAGVVAVSIKDSTWRLIAPLSGQFRVSPDCRKLAMLDATADQVWLCDSAGEGRRKLADLHGLPVWAPDGSSLIISAVPAGTRPVDLQDQRYETWSLDLQDGRLARTGRSDRDFISDWSSDGSLLLARVYMKEPVPGTQMVVVRPDGAGRRQLTTARAYHTGGRFSPDGRRIAYASKSREGSRVWVDDVDGKSPKVVLHEPVGIAYGVCWAPDGERLAVTRNDLKNRSTTVQIVVLKTGGRTELKLPDLHFNGCDWRC